MRSRADIALVSSGIRAGSGRLNSRVKTVWRRLSILVPLVGLVGCDHVTKHAAKVGLQHRPPHTIVPSLLDLQYVENTDVAFNALRWMPAGARTPLLLGLGGVLLVVLGGLLLRASRGGALRVGLLLIFAGALGNYTDRLLRGYVIDFVHVPRWPVFNVADICVTVGGAVLAWTMWRRGRLQPAPVAGAGQENSAATSR